MLTLTKKADYALVALAYLGQRRAARKGAVSARKISDQFGLPLPLLMNLLKELVHARMVISTRGSQGGYILAVDPSEISLGDVIEAVDGPVQVASCTPLLPIVGQGCPIEVDCPVRQPIHRLQNRLKDFLNNVSLADLLDSKVDVPVESVGVERYSHHYDAHDKDSRTLVLTK